MKLVEKFSMYRRKIYLIFVVLISGLLINYIVLPTSIKIRFSLDEMSIDEMVRYNNEKREIHRQDELKIILEQLSKRKNKNFKENDQIKEPPPLSFGDRHCRCMTIYFISSGPEGGFWPFSIFNKVEDRSRTQGDNDPCGHGYSFNGIYGGFGYEDFYFWLVISILFYSWKIFIDD